MRQRFSYYKWCIQYTIANRLADSLLSRLFWAFTGKEELLSFPRYHCPMKYNPKTGDFDLFYSWRDYKIACSAFEYPKDEIEGT